MQPGLKLTSRRLVKCSCLDSCNCRSSDCVPVPVEIQREEEQARQEGCSPSRSAPRSFSAGRRSRPSLSLCVPTLRQHTRERTSTHSINTKSRHGKMLTVSMNAAHGNMHCQLCAWLPGRSRGSLQLAARAIPKQHAARSLGRSHSDPLIEHVFHTPRASTQVYT